MALIPAQTLNKAQSLLFPRTCPGCGGVLLPEDGSFCQRCGNRITRVQGAVCMKCGRPLSDEREEYCSDCRQRKRIIDAVRAQYVYSGPMKNAMYGLKYSNRRAWAYNFSDDCPDWLDMWVEEIQPEVLIPIPVHKKKLRERGYNQAAVLARAYSTRWNIPVMEDLLIRDIETTPMKELSPDERFNNLKNAFKISKDRVKLKKILLIDDIFTTGATMDAAAEVLKVYGADKVYGFCICIGSGS